MAVGDKSLLDKLGLGNIVGEEGIKTDVTIKLSTESYVYLGLAIFISVVAVYGVTKILETILKKV